MKEFPTSYESEIYEENIYKRWEASGLFNPDNIDGEPYSIMMPPPNVTGILHIGHVLEHSLMDAVIRYQRMQGKKTLLLPGTDHAAVATQAKVERLLVDQGIKNPREELGREGLLKKIRDYAEESKTTILKQVRKLGTSADWSRLAYTFDDERSHAVNEVFIRMFNDGLIYRGHRVVNWSVAGQSTCSDDELEYVDRKATLYTFKYNKDFPFTIATTRPETKVGDTAVAVHPKDDRYKEYIGKTFDVTFCGVKLSIKVIADEHVDPEFGTGALGVTPAHSPVDFEMYEKQKASGNEIGLVQVIDKNGKMTDAAGPYVGKPVLEARKQIVEQLQKDGLLIDQKEIDQSVGTSDRFKDVVEAIPMTQWFVAVNKEIPGKGKTLKQLMKETVQTGLHGDKDKQVTITPDRFEKVYYNWIDNLRDWCISRQIWWGHRIPVWYKGDEVVASEQSPDGDGWKQDPDTLDTWFSSGLWTFSTLGWPEKTGDFKAFHPTDFMQMGYEILFFWMARMILMSTYILDDIPFKDVYIHGMVRDEHGNKFSKSSGNSADPLDVIKTHGADALRYSILAGISPGNDPKFYDEKVDSARNLVNKIWNVSRYILSQIDTPNRNIEAPTPKTDADKWIYAKLETLVSDMHGHFASFNYSLAATQLKEFTKDDLADWYLEIAKIESGADKEDMLNYILNTVLKLWHPFLPFVTEQIWTNMYGEDHLLMQESYPQAKDTKPATTQFETLQQTIVGIRALRNEYNIEAAKYLDVVIIEAPNILKDNGELIKGLARLQELTFSQKEPQKDGYASFVEGGAKIFVHVAGAMDIQKETERLQKEIDHVTPYIAELQKKLSNEQFTQHAPKPVVEQERSKLKKAQEKLKKLTDQINSL